MISFAMKRQIPPAVIAAMACMVLLLATVAPCPAALLVLCYHSIQPHASDGDPNIISQDLFIEQLEYLRTHGYQPISLQQLADAVDGRWRLPDKAFMLSFDDGYRSYYDFVFPLLKRLEIPSMIAVVGSWIEERPPPDLPEPLMSWTQIREIAQSSLVAVASHSYALHRAVQYTPQGNVGPVVAVRAYGAENRQYETQQAYRLKLQQDFERQAAVFRRRLGRRPRAMVWPYGHSNEIGMEEAQAGGLRLGFVLDENRLYLARLDRPQFINRLMIQNASLPDFIRGLEPTGWNQDPIRAVQAQLDLVYDSRAVEQTDDNLGRLIDRLWALKVNTVFLQAFSDPQGMGDVRGVYFHNRVMPVRADLFGHAVHQMRIRGMRVFAWMPVQGFNWKDCRHRGTRCAEQLFEDLAAGAQISGILFQDDARTIRGANWGPLLSLEAPLRRSVLKFRPDALFARNFEINPHMLQTDVRSRYDKILNTYNYAVVALDPRMQGTASGRASIRALAGWSAEQSFGRQKTVFKLQAYDHQNGQWVVENVLLKQMRTALAAGIRHLAYYPDNFRQGRPVVAAIAPEISTRSELRLQ